MRQDVPSGEMTGWGSVSRQARRIEKTRKRKRRAEEEGGGGIGGTWGGKKEGEAIIIANISLQWKLERGGYSNW